jgi:hypothetical protein
LKTGQPLPASSVEAMLVLTGEVSGDITNETFATSFRAAIASAFKKDWARLCSFLVKYNHEAALRTFGAWRRFRH